MHLLLTVNDGINQNAREPIHVLETGNAREFIVQYSPGFIQGIAAGDVIEVEYGSVNFNVVKRSGNICIQLFRRNSIDVVMSCLDDEFKKIEGRLDGKIDCACVYTVNLQNYGFEKIESVLSDIMQKELVHEWIYGNVYEIDGITPLNWWQPENPNYYKK